MADLEAWLAEKTQESGFRWAEGVSLAASGFCGLTLSGFWDGAPAVAVLALVGGSLLAGVLEGASARERLALAASWLVAGLSFSAVLALLGGVVDRITVVHLLPALLAHVLGLFATRVASRPVLVGGVMAALALAALLVPVQHVTRPPLLKVTRSAVVLLDGQEVDAATLAARFHAGERIRLSVPATAEAPLGSPARELANRLLVELEGAGVVVEPEP